MRNIQIIIADDHPIVRQGLKQTVAEDSSLRVVEEAGTGQELLEKLRRNPCDVVLLDIAMPGGSGLEVLKQIKVEKPDLPVLMLSIHDEQQYAVRSIRAGAAGYLTKASAPDELVTAIRRVAAGRRYISPSLAEQLADYLDPDSARPPHEHLSDREYQILCLIGQGRQPREIAAELHLSPKTISTYRTRILEKMNMKSNAELMRYAIENQLVP